MHETGRSTADPVGVFLGEPLHSGNDQTTLGGVVRHVGRHQSATTGQLSCLFQGEAISAHQHFHPTIAAQSEDHPDPRQVVANSLAHADAVGTLVAGGRCLQIVVDTVQTTHEHVVDPSAFWRQFAIPEVHASIPFDAHECTLPGCCPVPALPDLLTEFQITERNGDFLTTVVDMTLIHRA